MNLLLVQRRFQYLTFQDFMYGVMEEHRRTVDGSTNHTNGWSFDSEKVLSGGEKYFYVLTDGGSRRTVD